MHIFSKKVPVFKARTYKAMRQYDCDSGHLQMAGKL